jgi:hypothetical protein
MGEKVWVHMTDRRYGVNKYGDGKLYGPSDSREALAWDVSIDWDEDGVFEANEAARLTAYGISRGRTRLLKSAGEGFETIGTGTLVITLRNADGRFDAWNTASPIYPNVNYGKDIKVRVKDLATGIIYPRFRGTITNIVPMGYGEDAKVQLYASDGLEFLRNYPGRVDVQQNTTPDVAIGLILDAVQWHAKWGRSLDVSSDALRYWWASGNRIAMTEIEDLAQSFVGYFFVTAEGQARFVKRSSVSDAVASYEQGSLLKDIGNPQPYELLRNVVRLKVHPLILASTGVIWQLVGNTPSVAPGAANALQLFANYTYNNVNVSAINVITPVATTDFLVNTLADGSGTNLTGSCTVTKTDFGDTAKLVITNNSGSNGYITFLQIRGDAIYEPNTSDVTYPGDLSTVRSPRELVIDQPWQQDVNVAVDIANVLGAFFGGQHPIPNIKIDDRPALQYAADLFDICSLTSDYLGLNGESFRVGGIEEQTDPQFENCQKVSTRFYLEPYISADNYMQWDTNSVWDTSTVFGF